MCWYLNDLTLDDLKVAMTVEIRGFLDLRSSICEADIDGTSINYCLFISVYLPMGDLLLVIGLCSQIVLQILLAEYFLLLKL